VTVDFFSDLLLSSLILGGVGVTFAALIAVAQRRFRVLEDPRVDVITAMLPGSNCGACGSAGCRAFAETLVAGRNQPASCTVMGPGDIAAVAAYLGVNAGAADKRVARLRCAGGCDVAPAQAQYVGLGTCRAAAAVAGGGKACPWGCLGLGDCAVVCAVDAILMNPARLPVVFPERCTACGDCVEVCPKDLFVLMPIAHKLIVQCRNPLEGERATALCRVACNACGKCVLDAAPGLLRMEGGLPVVNHDLIHLAAPEATARCPTGAIVWVEDRQFTPSRPAAPAPA
jgi:Na+-translocating ferredoxin:NAD+ oxidoreductase RNF subunit RnfB